MVNRSVARVVLTLCLMANNNQQHLRVGILSIHGSHVPPGGTCTFQNECQGKENGRYYCDCPERYDELGDSCKGNNTQGTCLPTLPGGAPCDTDASCGWWTTGCGNETFTCTPVVILCFSGRSTVQVADARGTIFMHELRVGDRVRSSSGRHGYYDFARVYGFGHYQPNVTAEYLQLQTQAMQHSQTAPIEISSQHLLYIHNRITNQHELLPAGKIKIGDHLVTVLDDKLHNASHTSAAPWLSSSPVTSIRRVQSKGVYAPFTMTGDIVVNGVVASNYVALPPPFQKKQDDDAPLAVLSYGQQHWLQHAAYTPYRYYCGFISGCQNEIYHEETGLSNAVTVWLPLLHGVAYLLERDQRWVLVMMGQCFAAALGWYILRHQRQAPKIRIPAKESTHKG